MISTGRLLHRTLLQRPLRAALPAQPRKLPGPDARRARRALASYSGGPGPGRDKSWGEIAEEGANFAKDVASKVGKGVTSLVSGLLPAKKADVPSKSERSGHARVEVVDRDAELYKRGSELGRELFGSGLMGRAMGGLVGSALRNVGSMVAESSEKAADVQRRAARAIESDARVSRALGGRAQVGSAMSQASSTASINGRVSKRVSLVLPIAGANGRSAQAQVEYVEGSAEREDLRIVVRLPDGSTVSVGGGAGGGSGSVGPGETIDVDWQEVK